MKALLNSVLTGVALAERVAQNIRLRLRLSVTHRRAAVTRLWAGQPTDPPARPRVLAVVTHVAGIADLADPLRRAIRVERLSATVGGLMESFAYAQLDIALASVAGRSVLSDTPEPLRNRVRALPPWGGDPHYAGFSGQDELVRLKDAFDWFIAVEDDVVIRDACLLDKVGAFNRFVGDPHTVLMPQRYEMLDGRKVYIDLADHGSGRTFRFDRASMVAFDGFAFGECENHHAGVFCLTAEQVRLWAASGRHWFAKPTYVGPLESVHTGSLMEVFRLFKPVPASSRYLEVRHWDTKYGPLIARTLG